MAGSWGCGVLRVRIIVVTFYGLIVEVHRFHEGRRAVQVKGRTASNQLKNAPGLKRFMSDCKTYGSSSSVRLLAEA